MVKKFNLQCIHGAIHPPINQKSYFTQELTY